MVPLTPQAFAQRWGESTLPERSSYQQHFLDLCEMLGAPKPADIDPTGDFFTFEKGVEKTGGGKGFADVWYSDHFAIEYKGKLARCIEETLPHPRGEGSRGAGSANGVAATLSGLWRTRHSGRTATVRDTGG